MKTSLSLLMAFMILSFCSINLISSSEAEMKISHQDVTSNMMYEKQIDEMHQAISREVNREKWFFTVIIIETLAIIFCFTFIIWKSHREKSRHLKECMQRVATNEGKLERLYELVNRSERDTESKYKGDLELSQTLSRKLQELMEVEQLYLKNDLTREDLMDILKTDKYQLAAMFRDVMNGITLPTYLNTYRVRHAIELMKNKSVYTLEAISKESGFTNVRKFYRVFKEMMGMTPDEYRKVM